MKGDSVNYRSTLLVIIIDKANDHVEQRILRLVEQHFATSKEVTVIHANDLEKVAIFSTHKNIDAMRVAFYEGLGKRQREVTRLVVRGQRNEEIADQLGVVSGVVAARLTEIYGMLASLQTSGVDVRPNRQGLISFFGDFFVQHPDL